MHECNYSLLLRTTKLRYCANINTHNRAVESVQGEPVPEKNVHPLTPILIIKHPLSTFSTSYNPQHPPCSIYILDVSFTTTSVHVLFGAPFGLEPSASYFTQSFLFATQARTIATCFAALPRLCHLFLISLSQFNTWKSVFYLNATHPADISHLCWLKFHLILPARNYGNAGTNYNHLSVSVSVCHKSEFQFSDINVSQGSVATYARCGGIFNSQFTANMLKIFQ